MNATQINQSNWNVTDNRFVAFLDILGFKELIMRSTHDEIYRLLDHISSLRVTIENGWGQQQPNQLPESILYTASFSDSIIIFSQNDAFETFKNFCARVSYLFANAIGNNIPLKGAIAHGLISINKSRQIYFGQPIIDAYLLEEEVNYLGLVSHNSIDKYLSVNDPGFNRTLFAIDTPLKSGSIMHTNLNWFRQVNWNSEDSPNDRCVKAKLAIENLRLNVSGAPRKYVDNTLSVLNVLNRTGFPELFH